jgi:hypothetical protein
MLALKTARTANANTQFRSDVDSRIVRFPCPILPGDPLPPGCAKPQPVPDNTALYHSDGLIPKRNCQRRAEQRLKTVGKVKRVLADEGSGGKWNGRHKAAYHRKKRDGPHLPIPHGQEDQQQPDAAATRRRQLARGGIKHRHNADEHAAP